MIKALYLGSSSSESITVRQDGLALRVVQENQADRLYPLSRISRIISMFSVEWATSGLITCAKQGIPISFISSEGVVIARYSSVISSTSSIVSLLEDFLDRNDWKERYTLWIQALTLRSQKSLPAIKTHTALQDTYLQHFSSTQVFMEGLLLAHIHSLLDHISIAERIAIYQDMGLQIDQDFRNILARQLYPYSQQQLDRWLARQQKQRKNADNLLQHAALTRLYESISDKMEKQIHALIEQFYRFLLSWT